MIWAGGRGGGTSHPGLALGKFLTHRLAGENRRFFKHPGKSECVSDLCDFLARTSIVQSKSLTTPPIRTTKDVSPCMELDGGGGSYRLVLVFWRVHNSKTKHFSI